MQHRNAIAHDPVRPFPETLTHGMRQEPDGDIRVTFHVDSAAIRNAGAGFGLPGEAARLTGGHEDGVRAIETDVETTHSIHLTSPSAAGRTHIRTDWHRLPEALVTLEGKATATITTAKSFEQTTSITTAM